MNDSTEPGMEKSTAASSATKSSKQSFLLGIGVVVVLVLIGVVGYGIRGVAAMSTTPFVMTVARVLNLPAATVNGDKIPYSDFVRDVGYIDKFYQEQAAGGATYSEEEIAQQAMARLIANVIIEQVAEDLDIEITEEELAADVEARLATVPDRELAIQELQEQFGWTLEEYSKHVFYYQLLEERLSAVISEGGSPEDPNAIEERRASHILFQFDPERDNDVVKAEAQAVLDRIKAGEDFATLAQEFGSDGTAAVGGDLGFFERGAMVPPFEEAVFSMEPGTLADELVETQFGYHIIKVTDARWAQSYQLYMDNVIRDANIVMKIGVENPFDSYIPPVGEGSGDDTMEVSQ